jgi:hypothetical protein
MGPTQPPIQLVPVELSPGVNRSGREADHSPPPSAEIKNDGDIPPLLQTYSRRGVYLIKCRDYINFYLYHNNSGHQ